MTNVKNFNNQNLGEEIANAITHGLGALLAIIGTVVLVIYACITGSTLAVVSSLIYGLSLIVLYTTSTLYHSLKINKAKKVFQVLDHCSIFLVIVGSYTPICLCMLPLNVGVPLLLVNFGVAVLGIVSNAISLDKWHKLSLVCYLVMGWSVVFAIGPLLQVVNFAGFSLLLSGGLCYSIGVIFYALKKPRYMHSIWHLFVLGGSILHYMFVLIYVI